jgi:uncharacterized iron-regulated protein
MLTVSSLSNLAIFAAVLVFSFVAEAEDRSVLSSCLDKSVGACAVYDTGRLTNTPQLSILDGVPELSRHLPAAAESEILILGEVHDNPHHHKIRASLLSRGSIVMEQLREDQTKQVAAFNVANSGDRQISVEEFKAQVGWDNGGWAGYPYDPLLQAVVRSRLPVYAGDPPRDVIRKLSTQGPAALPLSDRKVLALERPLGDRLDTASAEEIELAHCGMLPKTAIPNMALAQRYRDAHLADATLSAFSKHGYAVLLTGNNHARTDRGVPWYIRARAPDRKVVAVAFVEVEPAEIDPAAYVPRDPEGNPAADYLIFTPPAPRDDPCKAFAK